MKIEELEIMVADLEERLEVLKASNSKAKMRKPLKKSDRRLKKEEDKMTEFVGVALTLEQKRRMIGMAKERDKTLSAFVRERCC